jgi:hypothetical protein
MFDKYSLSPSPSHTSVSVSGSIHEHRAPTDESVRLLREMEKAAFESVIERIDLKNHVKGTIIRKLSMSGFDHEIVVCFELNGEKYYTKPYTVPANYTLDPKEWVQKLINGMSEAIALKLLEKGFKELTGF